MTAVRSGLTVGRLARVAGPLCVLAFLVNATVVAVALQGFNVPADTETLDFPVLLFGSIGPVIGNSVGFYASYRKPFAASIVVFLTPGVVLTTVFMIPVITRFSDDADVGALIASVLVTVLPTVLTVTVLLRRRVALTQPPVSTGVAGEGEQPEPARDAPAGPPGGPGAVRAPSGPVSVKQTLQWRLPAPGASGDSASPARPGEERDPRVDGGTV